MIYKVCIHFFYVKDYRLLLMIKIPVFLWSINFQYKARMICTQNMNLKTKPLDLIFEIK